MAVFGNCFRVTRERLVSLALGQGVTRGSPDSNYRIRPMSDLNSSTRHMSGHLSGHLVHHVGNIIQIESVQTRFTKRPPGLKDVLYNNRLERLGQESLEMRRLTQALVFTYKVMFGLVSDSCNECS